MKWVTDGMLEYNVKEHKVQEKNEEIEGDTAESMESRAAEKCRICELEYRSGKRRSKQVWTELIIANRKPVAIIVTVHQLSSSSSSPEPYSSLPD
jgi:hypothetical protein